MLFRYSMAVSALAATGLGMSACASVIEGRSQQISVNTNPSGAECGLYREEGIRIATIQNTPGRALVEKTKNDIWVVCVKPGYQQATYLNHSGVSGAAFVNIIGGVFTLGISTAIGAAVDSSNGSDNKYESPVNMSMLPNAPDQPEIASVLPQTFAMSKSAQQALQQPAPSRAVEPNNGETSREQAKAAVQATSGPTSATLDSANWRCGITNTGNSNPYFIQFVVAADRTITVLNYANAPATIVKNDPLTFTAINPRGSRLTTFTLKPDYSMIVTGPALNNPGASFHNEGTCTKT